MAFKNERRPGRDLPGSDRQACATHMSHRDFDTDRRVYRCMPAIDDIRVWRLPPAAVHHDTESAVRLETRRDI